MSEIEEDRQTSMQSNHGKHSSEDVLRRLCQRAADLATPDERNLRLFSGPQDLQVLFLRAEQKLVGPIPETVRDRIAVARRLANYAWFCYEFYAVSGFWSVSTIELSLRKKFRELNPGPFQIQRRNGAKLETEVVQSAELERRLHARWRIATMPKFDSSFRALLSWASGHGILPDDIPIPLSEIFPLAKSKFFQNCVRKSALSVPDREAAWNQQLRDSKNIALLIEGLPALRNMQAHPEFNLVMLPDFALNSFNQLIEVVFRLW